MSSKISALPTTQTPTQTVSGDWMVIGKSNTTNAKIDLNLMLPPNITLTDAGVGATKAVQYGPVNLTQIGSRATAKSGTMVIPNGFVWDGTGAPGSNTNLAVDETTWGYNLLSTAGTEPVFQWNIEHDYPSIMRNQSVRAMEFYMQLTSKASGGVTQRPYFTAMNYTTQNIAYGYSMIGPGIYAVTSGGGGYYWDASAVDVNVVSSAVTMMVVDAEGLKVLGTYDQQIPQGLAITAATLLNPCTVTIAAGHQINRGAYLQVYAVDTVTVGNITSGRLKVGPVCISNSPFSGTQIILTGFDNTGGLIPASPLAGVYTLKYAVPKSYSTFSHQVGIGTPYTDAFGADYTMVATGREVHQGVIDYRDVGVAEPTLYGTTKLNFTMKSTSLQMWTTTHENGEGWAFGYINFLDTVVGFGAAKPVDTQFTVANSAITFGNSGSFGYCGIGGAAPSATTHLTFGPAAAARSQLRLTDTATAVTSPTDGDLWRIGTGTAAIGTPLKLPIFVRIGATTYRLIGEV